MQSRVADKSLDILQHLALRGSAWPEASSAAIRDLRARMLSKPAQNLSKCDASVAEGTTTTDQGEPSIRSSLHEEAPPTHNDASNEDISRETNGIAPDHKLHYHPSSAAFDYTATNNLSQDATLSDEHDSYWNIFLGKEGADASFSGYSNDLDPFSGFDIPFWFDQEHHWDFT
jgi:hypothetical protein